MFIRLISQARLRRRARRLRRLELLRLNLLPLLSPGRLVRHADHPVGPLPDEIVEDFLVPRELALLVLVLLRTKIFISLRQLCLQLRDRLTRTKSLATDDVVDFIQESSDAAHRLQAGSTERC